MCGYFFKAEAPGRALMTLDIILLLYMSELRRGLWDADGLPVARAKNRLETSNVHECYSRSPAQAMA